MKSAFPPSGTPLNKVATPHSEEYQENSTQRVARDEVDLAASQEQLVSQREGHFKSAMLSNETVGGLGPDEGSVRSFLEVMTSGAIEEGAKFSHGENVEFLRDAMMDAASLPRSFGPEGEERLLTKHDANRLDGLLEALSPEQIEQLANLTESLSGPSAPTARGLLLRAALARSSELQHAKEAMLVLSNFADTMQGLSTEQLQIRATVLDLNSNQNSSEFDPIPMWEKRGTIYDHTGDDKHSDNDGLFQRYTASCGPAALQMALAEADPVVAFAIHQAGLNSDSSTDEVAAFQKTLLESLGGIAIGRREAQLRARLRNGLGRLELHGHLNEKEAQALRDFALKQTEHDPRVTRALSKMRDHFEGFPSKEELQKLRAQQHPEVDEGLDEFSYAKLLNEHLGTVTGATYQPLGPPGGFARGQLWRYLEQVEDALHMGLDVPFGIAEPAHWMLLTAVKGEQPNRSFLVSDPDGGRTAWVSEHDFRDGSFADQQFQLCEKHNRPYVDSFILPVIP